MGFLIREVFSGRPQNLKEWQTTTSTIFEKEICVFNFNGRACFHKFLRKKKKISMNSISLGRVETPFPIFFHQVFDFYIFGALGIQGRNPKPKFLASRVLCFQATSLSGKSSPSRFGGRVVCQGCQCVEVSNEKRAPGCLGYIDGI